MGQYYRAVIEYRKKKTVKKLVLKPLDSVKLTHFSSSIGFGYLIIGTIKRLNDLGYDTRLVFVGDYANPEIGKKKNLYEQISGKDLGYSVRQVDKDFIEISIDGFETFTIPAQLPKYVVNRDRNEYFEIGKIDSDYNPLVLLTADGNGKGGGDYFGKNWRDVGLWKCDTIAVTDDLNKVESTVESRLPIREIEIAFNKP